MVLVANNFLILIADDDRDDQEFMKLALKDQQYVGQIRCVSDGNAVMSYLRAGERPPRLILLDLNMPLKDGYETLAEIKKDPSFRDIPTIVLTSSSRVEDEAQCYQLGCDRFFRKPLSLDEYNKNAGELLSFIE